VRGARAESWRRLTFVLMEQRQLGHTGLRVSRLGLGTMTWGRDTDENDAADQLKAFLDVGGTLIDTADVYNDGEAESIVGRVTDGLRGDVVIATKSAVVRYGDRRFDASRRHLLAALDASLGRLGTDYVDLWQLHAYDMDTPLDETLAALDSAVHAGKARYVGVSNYTGWQLAKAATWQEAVPGRNRLASAQVEYSLLNRDIEHYLMPAALDCHVGLLAWSPLGRGVLTGKYRVGTPSDSRAASKHFGAFVEPYLDEASQRIVDAVATASDGLGVAPLEVALAWVRDRPGIAAPIVGARTVAQLRGSLAADTLTLPAEIRAALDDVSEPRFGGGEVGWQR
jgi:aryl-alcohol dehydrogenase-like predicted oxidoreductase